MTIAYKGYLIKPIKTVKGFTVSTEGRGGKIPSKLDGQFTSISFIKNLIDLYVDSKTKKEIKDADKEEPKS